MDIRNKSTVDLIAPDVVQIVIRDDGKVVWVNADGFCLFRACRIGTILVEDQRKGEVQHGTVGRAKSKTVG